MAAPGLGVGDIVNACKFIYDTCRKYKNAPEEFDEIAEKSKNLLVVLKRLDNEAVMTGSLVKRSGPEAYAQLKECLRSLRRDSKKLEALVLKYDDIHHQGPARRFWWAFRESDSLNELRRLIGYHEQALQLWSMSLMYGAFRRLESSQEAIMCAINGMKPSVIAAVRDALRQNDDKLLSKLLSDTGVTPKCVKENKDFVAQYVEADERGREKIERRVARDSAIKAATKGRRNDDDDGDDYGRHNLYDAFQRSTRKGEPIDYELSVPKKKEREHSRKLSDSKIELVSRSKSSGGKGADYVLRRPSDSSKTKPKAPPSPPLKPSKPADSTKLRRTVSARDAHRPTPIIVEPSPDYLSRVPRFPTDSYSHTPSPSRPTSSARPSPRPRPASEVILDPNAHIFTIRPPSSASVSSRTSGGKRDSGFAPSSPFAKPPGQSYLDAEPDLSDVEVEVEEDGSRRVVRYGSASDNGLAADRGRHRRGGSVGSAAGSAAGYTSGAGWRQPSASDDGVLRRGRSESTHSYHRVRPGTSAGDGRRDAGRAVFTLDRIDSVPLDQYVDEDARR